MKNKHSDSPIFCNHANESPMQPCDCLEDCYCKVHGHCKKYLPKHIIATGCDATFYIEIDGDYLNLNKICNGIKIEISPIDPIIIKFSIIHSHDEKKIKTTLEKYNNRIVSLKVPPFFELCGRWLLRPDVILSDSFDSLETIEIIGYFAKEVIK